MCIRDRDDFELIAFDFVSNPSTHGAFLRPMNENIDSNGNDPISKINRIITEILTER